VTSDRYRYFRVEARDILDQLTQATLDLEKDAPGPDSVAPLLRLTHTLKGAARVVRESDIASRAHALEDALTLVRDVTRPLAHGEVDHMLGLIDEMNNQVARLSLPPGGEAAQTDQADPSLSIFRPAMDDLEALLGSIFEARIGLGGLRTRLAQLGRGHEVATVMTEQLGRPREVARTGGSILDRQARPMAEDLRQMFRKLDREWTLSLDHLDRELRNVREAAERLRLAPVRGLFVFLERAVRDVATELGKRVVFDAHGGDLRIDTAVLGVIQGALLHVVRNAAAHGIETESDRIRAGKPVEGRVTIRVARHGRSISFACADDGRGVDLDAVQEIARRRGAIDHDQTMGPEELLSLLLKGGMTTSGVVTGVSGRGIGLDVVREAAERLGGEVAARTRAGSGTTLELTIPLSIASFSALLVEGFDGIVAIPLDAVPVTMRIRREEIVRTGQHESVLFNGQAIPIVSLRQLASFPSSAPGSTGHVSVVVVRGRTGVVAFSVDRILGTQEIVMRRLPELMPAPAIVAGAIFDSAGDPQLVLDPDGLVSAGMQEKSPTPDSRPEPLPILVVDDSLTTRMLERSILESAGYAVDVATSGQQALEKAQSTRYALFLVDVEMPGMDGFTFIEQTRRDPSLQAIPSILVTSRDAPEDRQRGRDVGSRGYIVKSAFDQGALIEQIRGLIGS
jgi:two-component system chemotaxis sensor kinase CheA